jgi:hypothetical protein
VLAHENRVRKVQASKRCRLQVDTRCNTQSGRFLSDAIPESYREGGETT